MSSSEKSDSETLDQTENLGEQHNKNNKEQASGTEADSENSESEASLEELPPAALIKKISKLETALEKSQEQANKNWDIALRAKAEAENVVRRSKIDIENAHKYSIEKFAKEMLNILDSLELGLSSIPKDNSESLDAVKKGMELTHKLLLDSLVKFSIKAIDPVGEEFDPKLHEALLMQESDEHTTNKVITVVQKGFTLYDRVLRPAKVIVAK